MAKVNSDMDDDMGEINVVPLVDVMLVLLTIVLATATFVVNGRIPVDLAASKSAAPAITTPLVITLTQDQRLYVNDQAVTDLSVALNAIERSTPVVVRADGRLSLTTFVEMVDRVKGMGFKRVSLEVKRA